MIAEGILILIYYKTGSYKKTVAYTFTLAIEKYNAILEKKSVNWNFDRKLTNQNLLVQSIIILIKSIIILIEIEF